VNEPFATDTADVNSKKFDAMSLLDAVGITAKAQATHASRQLPTLTDSKAVGVLSFYINNSDYLKGKLKVDTKATYKLFIDGTESDGTLSLAPDHHTIALKYLAQPADTATIAVTIDAPRAVPTTTDEAHPYMSHDLFDGRRVRSATLSADGRFALMTYQTTERGGQTQWAYELRDLTAKTVDPAGRLVARLSQNVKWMPRTCAYIEEVYEHGARQLYKVSPIDGNRQLWAADVPNGNYKISPTEDYIVVTANTEGPKEDPGVFEVTEMDDRQPGWRTRQHLLRYDIASQTAQRITYGSKGEQLYDISQDGQWLLIGTSRSRLERRPTTVTTYMRLHATTLKADTLLHEAEHLGDALFSPDGHKVLFSGNPEAFDRVGCILPDSVTPNMIETELFIYYIDHQLVATPTDRFAPSVKTAYWSAADGMIYFTAEDRDYVRMYRMDPESQVITALPLKGDYIYTYHFATAAPRLAYLAYDTMAPASAYVATLKPKRTDVSRLFDGATALGDAIVGTCRDWNFESERGYTVYGRLYLPADFDATKKYPMIVYYYGGCSPVSRYFESPYAPQYWNSLGYVAYILQPSGATGFGQEWASRHVNTAGRGPADDIIEGTRRICQAHSFIDASKVGCMGASYGGFMTMYLQTVTDIFAAAVSHAGIANHTSYWGEGYWGYNYSEVSMANSYPWSHRQLYVDQSPLFRADKIHTPLLLLHGTADTNVPPIESLQMFTALKLLGREVALVEVEGENHHILDYKKRERWLQTQMAWFQKWLKDDPSWWDALYPKKNL